MKATEDKAQKAAPKKTAAKKTAGKQDVAQGLRDLFEDQLKDIYWAEKALVKALPKMAKNASTPELQNAINEHTNVTTEQISRLEQVFESIGVKAAAKKCEAMDGLLKEATEIMESTEKGVVRDAGIISASQKVEHYEIATYGTLASFAKILGESDAVALLETTLNEEKFADTSLTEIAESINIEAADKDEE
jgi:ferritin-like metal-binding protein YciE